MVYLLAVSRPKRNRPFIKAATACLLLIVSFGWTAWAEAAACSSNDYEFTTQEEVDALGATGCDSISGNLTLRPSIYDNSTDITNVDGLANLTSVGGYLRIEDNLALTNLSGLANITSVDSEPGVEGLIAHDLEHVIQG